MQGLLVSLRVSTVVFARKYVHTYAHTPRCAHLRISAQKMTEDNIQHRPEDPRLQFSEIDGALRISVFSYVPGADSATDIPKPCSDRTSYGRMYEVTVSAESQGMETKELFYDELERSPIEKNWMRFEHKGVVHYIRSLDPFIVLTAHQTGLKVVVRTEIMPFRQASERKLAVHGGSNPVLITKSTSPAEHLGGAKYASYYLGTFHTRDSKGRYRNYAFAFQAAKPFSILGISPQLPLVAAFLRRSYRC